MVRRRKQRRQQHGSAWHWKQTDCWYYTLSGTKFLAKGMFAILFLVIGIITVVMCVIAAG
jgi:hypothetical protein